jgi:hypothetical protein
MLCPRSRPNINGARLQVEQLEDRCVPTASVSHSLPVSAVHHVSSTNTGIPTTLGKVLTILKTELTHLTTSQHNLRIAAANSVPGSFSAGLLAQNIQLTQAEIIAFNNLYRTLTRTRPTPAAAYVKVFSLETGVARTNVALQSFQLQEQFVAGSISPFHFSTRF